MNRTQKFWLNALSAAIYQIVIMAVGFITPTLMIGTYGSEVNGLISSISQMIAYLSLVEAGLSGAAVYSLYKPLAEKDTISINRIVAAAKKYYNKAGYIFSCAAFILAAVYALLKGTADISRGHIFSLAILLSANGCVDFFILAKYRAILTADQKTYIISFVSILQTIVKTIIIVLSVANNVNIVWLHVAALLPIIIKGIWIPMYCKRCYPYLDANVIPNLEALGRRYDVIYQQILGVIQSGAPTMLATVFLNWSAVSVYSVYNMVLGGVNGVLGIFISGLPAAFGELLARKEYEKLRSVVAQFETAYYIILSVVYGLTLVLIMPFIKIYTATFIDANYYVPSLAVLIVVNGLFYNIKTPQSMLIISAGMYKETRWRVTVQGLIIILGGCALAVPYGLQGIIIASIASNLYRTVDLLFFVPKRITDSVVTASVFRMLKVLLTVCIIYLPSHFILIEMDRYIEWVIYALCYGIYALISTILIWYLTDKDEFTGLQNRLFSLLRRR